jgi:DTW domain-containing protein YfiP
MRHLSLEEDLCPRCRMRQEWCICEFIPNLSLRTKITLVVQKTEIWKSTNTARLVALAIPGTQLLIHGVKDEPVSLDGITRDGQTYLLFPDPSGQELTPEFVKNLPGPLHLVVPDGNWPQARKLSRHLPALANLPRLWVRSSGPDPIYTVRRIPKGGALCTLSAISRVLELTDGPPVREALENLLKKMVEVITKGRGRVASTQ